MNNSDKSACEICGFDKYKGSLHIHHKDGNHENSDESNLQVLCANCHFEYHHKFSNKQVKRNMKIMSDDEKTAKIRELEFKIENLMFEKNLLVKGYDNTSKQVMYLQRILRELLSFKEYKNIMNAYKPGWV